MNRREKMMQPLIQFPSVIITHWELGPAAFGYPSFLKPMPLECPPVLAIAGSLSRLGDDSTKREGMGAIGTAAFRSIAINANNFGRFRLGTWLDIGKSPLCSRWNIPSGKFANNPSIDQPPPFLFYFSRSVPLRTKAALPYCSSCWARRLC